MTVIYRTILRHQRLIGWTTRVASALLGAFAGLMLLGLIGGAVHLGSSGPRTCTFDGGGTIASGQQATTDTGRWECADGQLVKVALAAETAPVRHLPAWVHWRNAGRIQDCHGSAAVIVWGGKGDTSALICKNGTAETS